MTTTIERSEMKQSVVAPARSLRAPALILAACAAGLAVWTAARYGGSHGRAVQTAVIALWALCGTALSGRRRESLGFGLCAGAAIAGVWEFTNVLRAPGHSGGDIAWIVCPLALALVPAMSTHLVLALPDGRLGDRARRTAAMFGYALALGVAIALRLSRPSLSAWPVIALWAALVPHTLALSIARYERARGLERQRMQWFGWAVTVAGSIAFIAVALRLLVGWPHDAVLVAAVATAAIPIALAFGGSQKLVHRVDRLLAHTVSFAGLTGVVVLTYLLIVVGLGRVPTNRERTIIALSMAAAVVSALLYLPTRERLQRIANKVVYGERHAPDEALRTFGSRLSRAVPLDELLLQMAESLRKTLALDAVEVWTGSEGTLERAVSDPERGPARMTVGAQEQPVVARGGVSGPAWIKVWLPALLQSRPEANVRVAPITHQGQLLGMIIADRRTDEQFSEEEERVMAELARQVGLALHNVQLDSALQASLDEVKRQAEDLRASRQRIVVAADAARRKIEADIHDGVQQHLVALKVKVRLTKQIAEADPDSMQTMLDEMSNDVQATIDEVRAISHGVYPKILTDQGLTAALESASSRAAIVTTLRSGLQKQRYPNEIEAAVYFCILESLNNAAKHAGEGAHATVTLTEDEHMLHFEVSDDGGGFDVSSKGVGIGFTNLADRLGAVGGTLAVESAPGQGTKIIGRLPVY